MSRQFILQEWSNAAADSYTGYQVNRHFRKNGSAAIEAYGEPEPVKPAKKVKKPDLRTKNQAFEDNLDRRRVSFEKAFEEGSITFDQYNLLLTEWEKAMSRLEKRMGLTKEEPTSPTPPTKSSIINAIEDAAKGFAAKHPFMFLVASIMVGAGVLNILGFGA